MNRRIVFRIEHTDEVLAQSIQCAGMDELNPNADLFIFECLLNGYRKAFVLLGTRIEVSNLCGDLLSNVVFLGFREIA